MVLSIEVLEGGCPAIKLSYSPERPIDTSNYDPAI